MKSVNKSSRQALYKALSSLRDEEESEKFLLDLCTPAELDAMAERLEIAGLLAAGVLSYREIARKTGASTTTVGRVSRFLNQEPHQGYKIILERLSE